MHGIFMSGIFMLVCSATLRKLGVASDFKPAIAAVVVAPGVDLFAR
jgi:hypothetical protein